MTHDGSGPCAPVLYLLRGDSARAALIHVSPAAAAMSVCTPRFTRRRCSTRGSHAALCTRTARRGSRGESTQCRRAPGAVPVPATLTNNSKAQQPGRLVR